MQANGFINAHLQNELPVRCAVENFFAADVSYASDIAAEMPFEAC
ncbi:hypothetical protein ACI0FS_22690 [Ochrobactrum quorumnocens]